MAKYVAVAHDTSPYVSAYPWSGAGFGTKCSDPATLPANNGWGIAFSPSGDAIAVAHDTTPFVSAYPWSGAGFGTKFSDPATLPTGTGYSVAFSPSGDAIAVAHDTTPFVSAYPWSGAGFGTKFTNPATLPTGTGRGIAFSPAGDAIAVAHVASPYVSAYPWSGAGFGTKFSDPATLPAGAGRGIAFGEARVVGVGTTQNKTAGTTTVLTTTADIPAGVTIIVGYAVDGDGAAGSGQIVSIVDSGGTNTYAVAAAVSQGTTNAGVAVGAYIANNVAALASGSTITLDWTGASTPAAKAVSVAYIEGRHLTAPVDVIGTATGTSTTPSVSTSATTTVANVVTIGIVGTEGPEGDTFTQDTSPVYSNAPVRVGTTGGNAVTNIVLNGGFFFEAAVGVKTYNPTLGTSRDWAAVVITLKPPDPSKAFPFRRPNFNHILVR